MNSNSNNNRNLNNPRATYQLNDYIDPNTYNTTPAPATTGQRYNQNSNLQPVTGNANIRQPQYQN